MIMAYSPLAQGLLGGRYSPTIGRRTGSGRPARCSFPTTSSVPAKPISTLRDVADAHAITPVEAALAWAIRSPAVVAIPGASSVEQLERNAAAADVDLTDDEYRALNAASDRFRPVAGAAALRGVVRARLRR